MGWEVLIRMASDSVVEVVALGVGWRTGNNPSPSRHKVFSLIMHVSPGSVILPSVLSGAVLSAAFHCPAPPRTLLLVHWERSTL